MHRKNFFNFKQASQLRRYKKWRVIGMELNHRMMELAPPDAVSRAAGDLRLLKNDCICFESETDSYFLMDRVIHDIPVDGMRVVELYRAQNAKTLTADERELLDALADACYSLFIVRGIQAGQGVRLLDVFSNGTIFLTDRNLSLTAAEGHVLAARIVSLDGIMFSTGCACPFRPEYLPRLKDNFFRLYEKKKDSMTWAGMMRQYNPYFFITMKQAGTKIYFADVI